jgi:outer membrane protein TolC
VPLLAAPAWTATSRAKSQLRIAEASAADVRRLVAQTTARAYITVVAQHRLVAASETARETAKAHYDYAHTRLMGGIGHSIDEVRAQQDLATVETQLQANLARLAIAEESLGVLLAADAPVDALEDVALAAPPTMPEALEAVRTRTDVKVLTMRIGAAQRARNDVWSYYAPYLAAVGQPFAQYPASLLQPELGWQAQLVLTLPLYDGGLRSGITRERDAVLNEARANFEEGLRQAQSEVRADFEAMVRADAALASARDAARLARRALELANLAYKAGATTNLEVIDAARSARDADTAAAQAEDLARQARLDLLVASGRFP